MRNIFKDKRPVYGQDPHVTMVDGVPYLCESVDEKKIAISRLESLQSPRRERVEFVWDRYEEKQVWAPELHKIEDLWYIYYSASDGNNKNHRSYVLWSLSPFGPYGYLGRIGYDIWSIDMTTFEWKGTRYAVWSGWENNGDEFPQNLYIAKMPRPWEIDRRFKLSVPELEWEKSIAPILEGPQAWIKGNRLSLLYSANASWKQEYSTGMLTLVGDDPLNPGDWEKRSTSILGNAGHGCVVDDYFIYHRKLSVFPGWADREITSINWRKP